MKRSFALDENGQPVSLEVNRSRRSARIVDEILGFLKGILANRAVQETKIRALVRWLYANPDNDDCPIGVLVSRLIRVMTDDRLDPDEIVELRGLFLQITGLSFSRMAE
jgi:hypothetical protein